MDVDSHFRRSLCNVFLEFNTLVFFICEIIKSLILNISGKRNRVFSKISQLYNVDNSAQTQHHPQNAPQKPKGVRNVPGPTSLPIFGTLFTSSAMQSTDLFSANTEREKLYGTVVKEEHYWNFPFINVLDGENIKKIIHANGILRPPTEILIVYRSKKPETYPTMGVTNTMEATQWKYMHTLVSGKLGHIKYVKSMIPAFNDIARDTLKALEGTSGLVTDYPKRFHNFIGEAAFYMMFGKRVGIVGKETLEAKIVSSFADCHDMFWKAFHQSMYGFPWWKYFSTPTWKNYAASESNFMNMIKKLIDIYIQEDCEHGLLTQVKGSLTRAELHVYILENLLGATEPVYQTTTIILYWICKYEHISERVFEELKFALPDKDSDVDESVLNQLPYMKACVLESFRVNPAAPNLARLLDEDMLIGGYSLPKHTLVIIQTWYACMQECNFYRAKEYLPERWLYQNECPPFQPHERQLMCHFGMGARQCPGQKVALKIIYVYICKMLRKYKVKFPQGLQTQYDWLYTIKEPFEIELIERDA